jgi:hypothetical protein
MQSEPLNRACQDGQVDLMRSLILFLLGSLFLVAGPTGCNFLAPVSYVVEGTGTAPAEHVLEQVPTLVFVDDQTNVLPRTVLRSNLASEISQDLQQRELIPSFVNSSDAMAMVRSRERSGQRMSMESIAREAGVTQMIFVEMETFSLTQDSWIPRPNASCLIRVLDFKNGTRVYPKDSIGELGGRRINVTMREISPDALRSASARRTQQMALVTTLSRNIVMLFRERENTELGENLGVR